MKALFILSSLLLISLSYAHNCTIEFGEWRELKPIPVVHFEGGSAVIDKQLYVISGYSLNKSVQITTGRVEIFDVEANNWTRGPALPEPVSHAAVTTDGRYIWVAGGFDRNNETTDAVWRLDTTTGEWTQIQSLPVPTASGGLVIEGTTLHFIGGLLSRENATDNHWTLNTTSANATWEVAEPLPTARNHFQVALVGSTIYVIGGEPREDTSEDFDIVEAFDLESQMWSTRSSLLTPVSHAEGTTLVYHDRIIVIGGLSNNTVLDTIFEYDPEADMWTQIGTFPVPIRSTAAGVILNATINGEQGDYVVVVVRPTNFNNQTNATLYSRITFNCTESDTTDSSSGTTLGQASSDESSTSTGVAESTNSAPARRLEVTNYIFLAFFVWKLITIFG